MNFSGVSHKMFIVMSNDYCQLLLLGFPLGVPTNTFRSESTYCQNSSYGLTDNNKNINEPVSLTVNKSKQLHNKYSKLSMKRLYVEKIKSNCVFELEFGGNCSGWCWCIVHTCSSLDNEHPASAVTSLSINKAGCSFDSPLSQKRGFFPPSRHF